MAMSDPLGDMLARIKNGQMANKSVIECPYSKLRENVCKVLTDEGFIRSFKSEDRENNKKTLFIELKYYEGRGVIRKLDRVSKPGRRIYKGTNDMPRFYNGLGILIVSTPRGVMADYQAREANVGGEVLCQVF
ncbi:MAG: 30S ribosomal protein S8 [Micavibrio sp. TMED27]|nr:30S ribosomal protein S8 [Micavibrio sp.]OUT90583.1 MAG: 30S ribosomal protein S8 [Micavibrio sp. TMED27]|tara:strand:- start:196 stop:594 length:399 start_codon:yes stop_codon:yes gene_type:complete